MSDKERSQLQSECGILQSTKHPNIVEYYSRDHIKSESMLHMYVHACVRGGLPVHPVPKEKRGLRNMVC